MSSTRVILDRYATALHALAREAGIHEQVEAQVADLSRMLAENEGLRHQLASPRLPRADKKRLLGSLLGERTTPLLRHTVLLMADKGRAGLLPGLAAAYDAVAMLAAGRRVARVESVAPLDEAGRARLREHLERLTGYSVTLQESIDESLLGGLRVTIGSRMIDGSLKRRLETLRETMLRAPLGTPS